MKLLLPALALISLSPCALADYQMPGKAPKISCKTAIESATSNLEKFKASPDSYIDRTVLIGSAGERMWIIWFASSSNGFTILKVDMNNKVDKATQEEINTALGKH